MYRLKSDAVCLKEHNKNHMNYLTKPQKLQRGNKPNKARIYYINKQQNVGTCEEIVITHKQRYHDRLYSILYFLLS